MNIQTTNRLHHGPRAKRAGEVLFARSVRSGHSLVELLAVVAILAIVAAALIARLANYSTDSHASACYVNQGDIEVQAQLWYRNQGTWPAANLSTLGSNTKYFPEGHLPICPTGGTYSFHAATGKATCTHHP